MEVEGDPNFMAGMGEKCYFFGDEKYRLLRCYFDDFIVMDIL
jgi:hypothetical protein